MARYIDAEDLKAVIKANDWSNPVVPDVVGIIIDRTPTADVVPKSEVEALKQEIARLEKALRNSLPSYCQVMTEKKVMEIGKTYGRREVAREIFEEIESISSDFPLYGNINTVILSERDLAFIKKKYTEGEA